MRRRRITLSGLLAPVERQAANEFAASILQPNRNIEHIATSALNLLQVTVARSFLKQMERSVRPRRRRR